VSRMCVISTRQIYSLILGNSICALCSSYCPLALHYKLVVKVFNTTSVYATFLRFTFLFNIPVSIATIT
jgi:hypothetical protein